MGSGVGGHGLEWFHCGRQASRNIGRRFSIEPLGAAIGGEADGDLADDARDEADVGEDGGQPTQGDGGTFVDLEIDEVMVGVDFIPDLREMIHLTMEFLQRGFCAQAFGIDFEFDHDGDGFSRITVRTASKKNGGSALAAFIEAGDDALGLAFVGLFFEGLTLIAVSFTFADTDLDFDVRVLPVGTQNGKGMAFDLSEGEEL